MGCGVKRGTTLKGWLVTCSVHTSSQRSLSDKENNISDKLTVTGTIFPSLGRRGGCTKSNTNRQEQHYVYVQACSIDVYRSLSTAILISYNVHTNFGPQVKINKGIPTTLCISFKGALSAVCG